MAGAVVTIDQSDELRIERNLIRKEDMKQLTFNQGGDGLVGITGIGKADEPKPIHSEKLTRMLTTHRTAAKRLKHFPWNAVGVRASLSVLLELDGWLAPFIRWDGACRAWALQQERRIRPVYSGLDAC
jgi:hypothetical protein